MEKTVLLTAVLLFGAMEIFAQGNGISGIRRTRSSGCAETLLPWASTASCSTRTNSSNRYINALLS